MGFLLNLIAILATYILTIPCIIIGTFISICEHNNNKYYTNMAIGVDHLLNVICQHSINLTCLTKNSTHLAGNIKETISGVLGWNKKNNTLTKFGMWCCKRLNSLEKNHVEKSIDESIK